MKIILSRKGFDTGAGGSPSPLIPCDEQGNWIKLNCDKTKKWNEEINDWEDFENQDIQYKMYSIPIPQVPIDNFTSPYSSLRAQDNQGIKLTDVLNDITDNQIKFCSKEQRNFDYSSINGMSINMHLDPDIKEDTVFRWKNHRFYPAFGQSDSAEKFLQNQRIQKGDIFIFFGLFKEVYWSEDKKWAFLHKDCGIYAHVIWGYMKICDILALQTGTQVSRTQVSCTVGNIQNYIHTNVSIHPHMSPDYHQKEYNSIYVGDENCTKVFEYYDKKRDLSSKKSERVDSWYNENLIKLFDKVPPKQVSQKQVPQKQVPRNQGMPLKIDNSSINASGQWQEAVIKVDKNTLCDELLALLNEFGIEISKDCCQTNNEDNQSAKNR